MLPPSPTAPANADVVSRFLASARAYPQGCAAVCGARRVTYEELASRVRRVAKAFVREGLQRGDRVAILAKNSIEYLEVFLGALAAGACVVPLPGLASPDQLKLMMLDSRSKALVASRSLRELCEPFAAGLGFPPGRLIGVGFGGDSWADYGQWLDGVDDGDPGVSIDPDGEFSLVYSSGTTGVPKGILHTHSVRWRFTEGCSNFGFGPGKVNLASTPLYSNTTMVGWLPTVALGGTNVLMEKFDARGFAQLCQDERVTHAMMVPVQYERILALSDLDRFDLSSFQMKLCTSAPLRPEVKQQIVSRLPGAFVEIYGLTEGGVSTLLFATARPDKLESVGQASPGCEIRIIDENGHDVAPGSSGEIVGRNSVMMERYENQADATASSFWCDQDGKRYFRTGDLGRLDDEGFLYLAGRKKDMIISGGFNVYPGDLEAVLHAHPDVNDAAVVGVPSAEWGETPLAVVVLKRGATTVAGDLLEWANARLGKGQRMSKVEFRSELPRNAIGKVLKRELRAPYWSESR